MLKSKIHRARVTGADVDYSGSITIDSELLRAADIYEREKVQVVNITNGARLETYAIAGSAGSGEVVLNGAAAKVMRRGDIVIIISYTLVGETAAKDYQSIIVNVDESNHISSVSRYTATVDVC